jgi:hypothetical protein
VEQETIPSTEKRDYISELFALCSTLSDEALASAEARARANNFDLDRGEIPFKEIQINFISGRDVIDNAIREQKLIQLPITVQKRLLSSLEAISKALQGFMADTDQTVNFEGAVESLNTSIWQYGLNHLSDQILGYQKKMNQLKQQEVQISALLSLLESGKLNAEALKALSESAQSDMEAIAAAKGSSEENAITVAATKIKTNEDADVVANSVTSIRNAQREIDAASTQAQSSLAAITPMQEEIETFFGAIEKYRGDIDESVATAEKFLASADEQLTKALQNNRVDIGAEIERLSDAAKEIEAAQTEQITTQLDENKATLEELVASITKNESARLKSAQTKSDEMIQAETERHKELSDNVQAEIAAVEAGLRKDTEEALAQSRTDIKAHIEELEQLKERVKEQVAHATGVGQFGAFNKRQRTISDNKYLWVGAIAVLVAIVVGLTYVIARDAAQGDLHSAAFWIKLSMNIPLGFLISFCTIQYNRERRLEEEYAFKASISISLTPYRELIYQILEKDGAVSDGSYTTFVIDSVRNIFSSPTEKIFDSPKRFEGISEKSLKATAELIGTAVKAAK